MSDWWYVIAVVGVAAAGILYLRARGTGAGQADLDRSAGAGPRQDFMQDREDSRQAHMSVEDRAWEDASLRTNREARERDAGGPGGLGGA